MAAHGASRRVYSLASYQEDTFFYIVLKPEARARLVKAGVKGIATKVES